MANKRALIVGGSRGVGAEIVRLLVQANWDVCFTYKSRIEKAKLVQDSLEDKNDIEVAIASLDLAAPEEARSIHSEPFIKKCKLDALVISVAGGLERNMPSDYAERVNASGPVKLLSSLADRLNLGAQVILITSHEAYFFGKKQAYEPYFEIARTKKLGERNLTRLSKSKANKHFTFHIVSSEIIANSTTAKLLERVDPGILRKQEQKAGNRFPRSTEVAQVVSLLLQQEEWSISNTIFVGDPSSYLEDTDG